MRHEWQLSPHILARRLTFSTEPAQEKDLKRIGMKRCFMINELKNNTVSSPYVHIKESAIHNRGGYASCDIPKGTRVIQYVGEKITKKEAQRRCEAQSKRAQKDPHAGEVYVFELDDEYDVDGNVEWNPARFINHSCEPNCRDICENGEIWIVALRDIKKGEELTYNYRFGLEDFEQSVCRCGSNRCFGYILDEEDWPAARAILQQKR